MIYFNFDFLMARHSLALCDVADFLLWIEWWVMLEIG